MRRTRWVGLVIGVLCLLPALRAQNGGKYAIKNAEQAPPAELSEAIRKELKGGAVQFHDPAGKLVAELWFRKAIPSDATPEQAKSGATYREVKQTELFGAVKFHRDWHDYRKQKVAKGVYTLRLAYQPTDGKHTADVSEFPDFLLVTTAKTDTDPARIEAKKLQEVSADSIGSGHPGVFMLAPNGKPGPMPQLVARPRNEWVLLTSSVLLVEGKANGRLGIGLTLVGHSPAE